MKKVLMMFLVLAALGGSLFAQDFKWSGVFNSGLGFLSSDRKDVDPDPYITAAGVDSQTNGYRLRLNGAYANAEGSAGVKVRLSSQTNLSNAVISLPYAYGYVKPLGSILTITGGLVDDGTFATGGTGVGDDVGEGLGALAVISPITGLNLGLGAYVLSPASGSGNYAPADGWDFRTIKVEPGNAKYTLGFGYTMKDVFKLTLAFRTRNETGANSSRLIIGADISALSPLVFILEADLDNLDAYEDKGTIGIHETVSYPIGDLTLGLNAGQYLRNTEGSDLALRVNPYVSYALGSVVPRLDLLYFMAGASSMSGAAAAPAYHYYAQGPKYDSDYSLISIRPSVKISIDSKAKIEIGDLITLDSGPKASYAIPGDLEKASRFGNALYVDFIYSF
jgi:hypothetical protein